MVCFVRSGLGLSEPRSGVNFQPWTVTDTEMAGESVSVAGWSFDVDIRTSGRPDEETLAFMSAREPKASAVAY